MPAQPPAHRASRLAKLAAFDWAETPQEIIRKEFKVTQQCLSQMRQEPMYQEMLESIRQDFRKKLLSRPETNEIAKTLGYALGIATKKLVHLIASPRTSNKDLISAARLVAQMDGRFLGNAVEDEGRLSPTDAEEIATELRTMLDRKRQSVQ